MTGSPERFAVRLLPLCLVLACEGEPTTPSSLRTAPSPLVGVTDNRLSTFSVSPDSQMVFVGDTFRIRALPRNRAGELLERSFKCLARAGRIVTCGATAGAEARVPLRAVFFKSLSLLGSTMGSLGELERLLPWFETGALVPVVADVLPLERAREAQERLAGRGVFGKLVLDARRADEVPRPKEVSDGSP